MTVGTLGDILEVLDQRRHQFRELLELSRLQQRTIEACDYSQLFAILAQKQRVLGRLEELKRHHPNLGTRWESLRKTGSPESRRDCETALEETEAVLAELLKVEQQGAEHLVARRDATRRQIEGLAQSVRVNDSYCDSLAPVNHRFLDTNR